MRNPLEGSGPVGRAFALCAGALAIATVIGVAILWPSGDRPGLNEGLTSDTYLAEVVSVELSECPPPQTGECGTATIGLEEGPEAGDEATIELGQTGLSPALEPGDRIRVIRAESPSTDPLGDLQDTPEIGPDGVIEGSGSSAPTYTLSDFERRGTLLWLALAFALLVIAFGRLRGALSLVGLGASLAIIVFFIVPAILDGSAPLAVAVVGSLAVMLVTITLAHGVGPKSLAAILGTTVSLALVAILGSIATGLTNLTGLSSEEATILQVGGGVELSLTGLLLAGMVIGALGVLDDVTISQSSTVLALRSANPGLGRLELFRRAMEVGRDHVSATVNTLVLAYAGSALPVLLILSSGDLGLGDALNAELVAREVVATLVGSIGLIAAVPVTTGLAALLAPDLSDDALAEAAAHGHSH